MDSGQSLAPRTADAAQDVWSQQFVEGEGFLDRENLDSGQLWLRF